MAKADLIIPSAEITALHYATFLLWRINFPFTPPQLRGYGNSDLKAGK